MNEDYSESDFDCSEMLDDELLEIVNAGVGCYRQTVVDGAKNELKNRKHDTARIESPQQVMIGEVPPPVLLTNVSGSKLFSAGQITLATFLGAPIAGCLLLAQNYRALGKGGAAWQSLVAGIAATILLIIVGGFLPEHFPNAALPVGYCLSMHRLVKRLQGGAIDSHLQAGGRQGSWAVTTAVGLGCLVIIFGLLFAFVITFNVQDMPVAKVKVSQAGQIDLNGTQVNREQLRTALANLRDDGGVVWYYRERWEEQPSEEAAKVLKIIIDAKLPIRMSSKPDFSDYIGADGRPVPSQ